MENLTVIMANINVSEKEYKTLKTAKMEEAGRISICFPRPMWVAVVSRSARARCIRTAMTDRRGERYLGPKRRTVRVSIAEARSTIRRKSAYPSQYHGVVVKLSPSSECISSLLPIAHHHTHNPAPDIHLDSSRSITATVGSTSMVIAPAINS